jgi:hypothetical protein
LEKGIRAEKIVLKLFNGCGIKTVPVDANGPHRDFWDLESTFSLGNHDQIWFTTEVKYDIYEATSNNIAIEVENSELDKPSGLEKTRANLWAHVLCDSIWITTTKKLRWYVKCHKPIAEVKQGGDKNAHIKLYQSCQILPDVFSRIDNQDLWMQTHILRRLAYESSS